MESRGTAHRNILRRRSTRKLLSIRSVLNDRRAAREELPSGLTSTEISTSESVTTHKSKMLKVSEKNPSNPRARSCTARFAQVTYQTDVACTIGQQDLVALAMRDSCC